MNLRNRKTGETGYYLHTHRDSKTGVLKIAVLKDGVSFSEFKPHEPIYDYDSLAGVNEEWEDYEPAEPLIKDEKIRKAVRAWAEANGVDRAILGQVNNDELVKKSPMTAFGCNISFEGSLGLERGRNYTIIELCGKEEK